MTDSRHPVLHAADALLASAGLARAFTLTALGAVFAQAAIQRMTGLVVYATVVVGLCVVGAAMLVARRRELSALRLVPLSLLVFVGWAAVSTVWSSSPPDTVAGWLALAGVSFLAVVIGHVRDTLQTARALGDVMRWLLSISLGLEIVIGLLMRHPVHFLGIQGNIAMLGPAQGIFGTRNMLGFVSVLALITFIVEWRTASVRTGVAAFSVSVAGVLAVLSGSPMVLVLAVAVGFATGILILVRRAPAHDRVAVQWVLGATTSVGLVVAYVFRHQLIAWLGAGTDFSVRADLWRVLSDYVRVYPVQGFGWFGAWPVDQYPFTAVNFTLGAQNTTALNAYADLVLQVGWVGLFLFAAVAGTALVRAWLAAGERRSVMYAWTPLMLVAIATTSLFESFALFGPGLLVLIVCAVRARGERSWRVRLEGPPPPAFEA